MMTVVFFGLGVYSLLLQYLIPRGKMVISTEYSYRALHC